MWKHFKRVFLPRKVYMGLTSSLLNPLLYFLHLIRLYRATYISPSQYAFIIKQYFDFSSLNNIATKDIRLLVKCLKFSLIYLSDLTVCTGKDIDHCNSLPQLNTMTPDCLYDDGWFNPLLSSQNLPWSLSHRKYALICHFIRDTDLK